jgi:pyruvate formate lyase activating enzyme
VSANGTEPESTEKFLAFLDRRRGKLSGVVVSGGEPCLQEDLAESLRAIRSMGFHTKLDTNGTRPQVLAALLKANLLDCVAMDIKGPRDRYAQLSGTADLPWDAIRESVRILSGAANQNTQNMALFRTTVMEPQFDTESVLRMRELAPRGLPWRLQPYAEGIATLDPAFRARPPSKETLEAWQRIIDER